MEGGTDSECGLQGIQKRGKAETSRDGVSTWLKRGLIEGGRGGSGKGSKRGVLKSTGLHVEYVSKYINWRIKKRGIRRREVAGWSYSGGGPVSKRIRQVVS